MKYGYARVSTGGQSVAAQVAALSAAGAGKVFREVASGAKTNRTQLRKAIAALSAGDVLMVTRLDRLARSTRDLLNTLAAITDRKAGFRSLSDAWADTATSHGRLMLTVLGGLAEFERDLIRACTSEGRERARARGVRMAARPSSPHTSGARRSGAATAAPRRWRTSPAATTSARRRFRGSDYEVVLVGVLNRLVHPKRRVLTSSRLSSSHLPSCGSLPAQAKSLCQCRAGLCVCRCDHWVSQG